MSSSTYAFAEHLSTAIPLPAEHALALVRDEDMWSGFIGWLAGHLKAVLGTGVLVIRGCNGRRGGIFDYWCVPERIGEETVAEVNRLRLSAG